MSPLLLFTGSLYWSAFVFSSDLLHGFINKRTGINDGNAVDLVGYFLPCEVISRYQDPVSG